MGGAVKITRTDCPRKICVVLQSEPGVRVGLSAENPFKPFELVLSAIDIRR